MAYDGILKCFGQAEDWVFAAVVTNGVGSPRDGLYAGYTDDQMRQARRGEQKKAAYIGEYGGLALLNYTSSEVKDPGNEGLVVELEELVTKIRPKVIYAHNLPDKHDTHVAVIVKLLKALRTLSQEIRSEKLTDVRFSGAWTG
jgi:LmbE family N-acetylglucosaminyl deacetylase